MVFGAPPPGGVLDGSEPLEVFSPAKINLFLAVTGRRPDGYHELVSLMCTVRLGDRIRIRFAGRGISAECIHPEVPAGDGNLAVMAARAFVAALDPRTARGLPGLRIGIDKTIPVGAGLGGGSSNAAAVLTALNRRFGDPLPAIRLHRIALDLGADVPFFLEGGPALARGVGERLTPFPGLDPMAAVIVYPGFPVSTAAVFRRLKLTLTKCEKKLRRLLLNSESFCIRTHLCNDLEATTFSEYPVIGSIKETLRSAGADGALMSGSGSAVFGLFPTPDAAARARRHLADRHPEWQVFHTSLDVSR